ncbi:chemotaxis response regulator protein-glutamate methylesterase [Duganella sp. BJB488]|uniref:Protein-glutamate methylesterase/protein-glutamine glutaminase n=1 Tax=Duganella vulcania TaxID=2692166 RepID=A0A845HTX7_9BURK|nr:MULTISPECIES: chemotaxis response regulator protein-glutamate methylesterase [Duganella]MYM91345.1 chemotaxis-specific protein-glutamate methyltransferase CheB [Duganella vulcania]MYN20945.1 chemotaxis-specific protein-glutamate methyltransferase CheB [Duganella vulcania]RFP20237.1 chemotaxis response regulator protein-glutamate methylesterase [Duganella sp. BJB489]RFP21315.1 chemotaxis response regulator protein-glutamate methylesterase [Duganella sp. BJB488]RFP33457.1 chemotaxis response 
MKIKVLIVDDSALIRSVMSEIINSQPDMEVVGTAPDPLVARELIKQTNPDVLTLDVEMPKMDGLDFLEKLMRLRPMPVVMVSSLTERGSEITMRALELGAVDFVTKPKISIQAGMREYTELITDKIRAASKARVRARTLPQPGAEAQGQLPQLRNPLTSSEKLIIIGASTGGTEAIREFLMQMPSDCPGILITQHMPEGFTRSFAKRLDSLCKISVQEAAGNERVLPGHAYIAPGHSHLYLTRSGANYMTKIDQAEPVNRHRPSVDVLFRSAAQCAGKNAVGVILTGMGKDGAAGMLEMKQAGAYNFAQDEASCVVFGMPREAIAVGAAHEVGALQALPGMVLGYLAAHGMRALRV